MLLALAGTALFAAALVVLAQRPIAIGEHKAAKTTTHAPVEPTTKPAPERYVGVVVSRAALDVTPRIDGQLKQLFVNVGQEVKANDKIALIDDSTIRKDLQLAQATLQASRAGLSRAEIELGEARAKAARRDSVAAELSKEELSASKATARLSGASLTAAQAGVAEQKARIAKLMEALEHTEVRAPFPGKIATLYVAVGALLTAQTPIVRVVQNEDLCVRFAVPALQGRNLDVGKKVRFDLETVSAGLPGTIENIAPEVDPGSQMLYVEASLDLTAATRAKIQPGLVTRVRLADTTAGDRDGTAWKTPEAP
jgi:RND family efflux transporter MFP subunit